MVTCAFEGQMGTMTMVSNPESSRKYVENANLNDNGGIWGSAVHQFFLPGGRRIFGTCRMYVIAWVVAHVITISQSFDYALRAHAIFEN